MLKIAALLLILILAIPVLGAETVTKENYGEPDISVNNKTYIPNETTLFFKSNDLIEVTYVIKPKTDDDAKIIDNRDYDLYTDLVSASVEYKIFFKNGASVSREGFTVKVPDADALDGVESIEIDLKGYIQETDVRFKEIMALRIRVQDGGYVLPDVFIYVKNDEKFLSDLNGAKNRYNELSKVLTNYTGKVDVSNLKRYLDLAKENLTLAEGNLNEKDYMNADIKLSYAESWLEKAGEESVGVEARYMFTMADKKINNIGGKVNEMKIYIDEIEKKDLVNTSILIDYKIRYNDLKGRVESLIGKLAKIGKYIDMGSYRDAKREVEDLVKDLNKIEGEINEFLSELKSILSVTPKTPTPTQNQIKIDWNAVKFYVGIIGGCIAVAFVLTVTLKRYMRRRRWDELR